jgi:hypothetical protein
MDAVTPAWTFRRRFSLGHGLQVEVLRRTLNGSPSGILLDLEPFFSLPTLAEFKNAEGEHTVIKDVLKHFEITGARTWHLTFRSPSPALSLCVIPEKSPYLTVWRVNDGLDALQFRIDGASERLYLQTGGAALLNIITGGSHDKQTLEVLGIFRESLITERESTARILPLRADPQ